MASKKDMPKDHQTAGIHIPVLLEAVCDVLRPREGQSYLDLTAGYGGHAAAIIEATEAPSRATLVDRDQRAAEALQQRFASAEVEIVHQDFASASQRLVAEG